MILYPERRTHIGALLFTVLVGIAIFTLLFQNFGTSLFVPPPTPTPSPTAAATAGVPPSADQLHARWVSQSGQTKLVLGESSVLTFIFRNTGPARWLRGANSEVRLGLVTSRSTPLPPGMAVEWLAPERPARHEERVVEREAIGNFRFTVKGVKAGTYTLALRLVAEGITWLEDEGVFVEIIVAGE